MAVLLQTFEDGEVMMYNYRTIYLTDYVVSAEYLFKELTAAFATDGLEVIMKKHLVAMTTDGMKNIVEMWRLEKR